MNEKILSDGYVRALRRDERGVTALETAIILIAFVVVASVFAFTILSSGVTSTEKAKEAIVAGLEDVQGTMELKGSVIATADSDTESYVAQVILQFASVAGGKSVDLHDKESSSDTNNVVVVNYRDADTRETNVCWSVDWLGYYTNNELLDSRELAEITVPLNTTNGFTPNLGTNSSFMLEVIPPSGAVIIIERTIPASIFKVMDLG